MPARLTKAERTKRAFNVIRNAKAKTSEGEDRIGEINLHTEGYAEPGYSSKHGIVATGNWNEISEWKEGESKVLDITPSLVAARLEKLGVDLEWSDEWEACCECRKLVRTSPDSYGWKRAYWMSDDGAVCQECIKDNPESYLESLENNDREAMTINLNLTEHNYVLLEDGFENGLYGGQAADPKAIAKALREQGITRFIFNIDGVGQFDLKFSVYVHKDQMDKLDGTKYDIANKNAAEDPAEAMKRGLQSASIAMSQIQGDGIKVAIINGDTASVRVVSPQDFVEGKALH